MFIDAQLRRAALIAIGRLFELLRKQVEALHSCDNHVVKVGDDRLVQHVPELLSIACDR